MICGESVVRRNQAPWKPLEEQSKVSGCCLVERVQLIEVVFLNDWRRYLQHSTIDGVISNNGNTRAVLFCDCCPNLINEGVDRLNAGTIPI